MSPMRSRLAAHDGFGLIEGGAVGAEAEDGQDLWMVTKYLCLAKRSPPATISSFVNRSAVAVVRERRS